MQFPLQLFLTGLALAALTVPAAGASPAGQDTARGARFDLTTDLHLDGPGGQFAQLFAPDYYRPPADTGFTLVLHLHGASWTAENMVYQSRANAVLVNIHLAGLSSAYQGYFTDPDAFGVILDRATAVLREQGIAADPRIARLMVTSFSAGYGGVREVLESPVWYDRIDALILADGLHSSSDSTAMAAQMTGFLRFAWDALKNRKVLIITHSSIATDGYASTTETAGYLLRRLNLERQPVDLTDVIGRQVSRVDAGRFHLRGYRGETAPDHMKHLHGMHLLLSQVLEILDAAPTARE